MLGMKKPVKFFLFSIFSCVFFLCVPLQWASSEESANTEGSEGFSGDVLNGKNVILGFVESQATNGLLFLVNRIAGTEFSGVTLESIKKNLTSPWQWDQSLFRTNELGHPYQGVFYYQAGRANNWNFYESTVNAVLGSVVWEVFCERSRASINDLFITTAGGVVYGEALHRLYYAAEDLPAPLRFLISPFDFLNPYLPGEKTNRPSGKLWAMDASAGLGFGQVDRNLPDGTGSNGDFSLTGFLSLNMVYNDPFTTYVPFSDPFRQFEMSVAADIGYPVYQLSIFTEGFLFAVPVITSGNSRGNMGLSLHYDCVLGDTLSFGGTSLDFGFKFRQMTSLFNFDLKLHAGWLMFASANTYYPNPAGDDWSDEQIQLYGTGANVKFSAGITESRAGNFLLVSSLYFMPLIPAGYSDSGDLLFFWQAGLYYDLSLTKNFILSFATVHSFSYEVFASRRDIVERSCVIRLGAGYRFDCE